MSGRMICVMAGRRKNGEMGQKIKITNIVPYAPFVQGDSEQAWMHKGIWRKTSKIISDNQSVMDNAIDKEVKKYLREKRL